MLKKIICVYYILIVLTANISGAAFAAVPEDNCAILDSIEFDGYTWDVGANSGKSPETKPNRRDVLWMQDVDRTVVKDGIISMIPGKDGSVNKKPGFVTQIGGGLHTKDIKYIQMRVRVSDPSLIKMYYISNIGNSCFEEGDAAGNRTLLAQETVPADGEWHIVNMVPTSDVWVNNADHVLSRLWFQAAGAASTNRKAPDLFEIDRIRYMGDGIKYVFEEPVAAWEGNTCRVKLSSFENRTLRNLKLGLAAAAYNGGKLMRIKYTEKYVAGAQTAYEIETVLRNAGANENVKAYLWDMDSLMPLSANPDRGGNAETESHGGADNDKEVKVFLEDEFGEPFNTIGERRLSGWNLDMAGGLINRGDIGTIVEDNSDVLPVILEREFENMTYGEAFMDIRLKFQTNTDGAEWVLRCDDKKIMGFALADGNIELFTPQGTVTALKNYKYNDYYYIKFDFDVDKQTVKGVYIDGKCVAENIPFVTPVSKINNFVMRTYDETKGRFMVDMMRIYRGYKVFEQFRQTSVALSEDWENVTGVTKVAGNKLDFRGNQKIRKSYTRETRKTASDFYILMPKSRNGLEVSINDGEKKIAGISTTDKGFAYFTGKGAPTEFYEQFENVMYNFKLVTDFESHTMDLYMNNRLMQSGIPLAADAKGTDNITVSDTVSGESIYFTAVTVYPVIEYDDYCPEPQAPPKDDIDIIMQMCPMWSEGYHFGYDHLNASPSRKPLLGFYDESDPEASDWTIKFMVEHGIDVRTSIWYRNGGINAPLREYTHTPQYKTMQNAKYADKMQWFILWDNSSDLGLGSADKNLDAFLKYVAPFWIEYYFKDPNYYKINGRPVIGAYYFWTIQGDFTQDTRAGLDKFRQLCVDSGVGEPLFWLDRNSDAADSETHFKQMDKWGVNLQSQYHQEGKYIEGTKNALLKAKEYVVKNNLSFQTVPVVSPGFDDYAWGRSTGRVWDNDMLREMFEYIRDEYFEGLPTPTGRKMMLLATWDEYAEGHIFSPTASNGFGYLDVLRDVFAGGEHTDILPTEHQYDRFNNRYPSWRKLPYTWEKQVTKDIPKDSYVKMSWDFNTDGDFGGWEAESGYSAAEVKDGYLKCTSSGGTGKLTQNIDIPECEDILQIRIKYKNMGSAYNANLYYTNQFITSIPNRRSMQDHIKPNSEGELVFTPEKYPFDWKGRINKLQLQLAPFENGEELYIDSIEVYAKHKNESKMRLNLNDCVSETDGVVIDDENAMIPVRDVAWAMKFDDKVHYEAETDTIKYRSYSDDITVVMPAGGGTFTIDGKEYPSEGYYSCEDGVCRVTPLWAAEVLGKDAFYDSASNTFYIKEKSVFVPQRSIEERELVYSADFDSGNDGFNPGQYTSGTVENGVFKLKTMKGDPQFINHTIGEKGIDCADAKVFAIKTTVEKECMIKVYFSTTKSPAVAEYNSFYFYVPVSAEPQVFSIDVSDRANWEGTLTYLRIDAEYETENSFDIDWIRFYGDFPEE